MKTEQIAMVCHEANRTLCDLSGDYSQVGWNSAPEWQKASAIKGVEAFLANPAITPEQLHMKWLETKLEDGWVFGEVKDANKKTHPCMLAYHELPAEQKRKDSLFRAICQALTAE